MNRFITLVFSGLLSYLASYGLELQRMDFLYSYEYLTPNSTYGEWHTLNAMSYWKAPFQITPVFGVSLSDRTKEGKAVLVSGAFYKDWTNSFFTYSAISSGTNSAYYPKVRFDQEFNFKTGVKKNIVLSGSVSYIKYWDVHKDWVFGAGGTIYTGKFIYTGRYFYNISSPGNIKSSSYLVSAGYGAEKKGWTYLNFYFGKQAYLATYLLQPEEINQNAYIFEVIHRHWIGYDYGYILQAGYMKLEDSYEKYSISGGFFKEF